MARLHGSDLTACTLNAVSLLPDLQSFDWKDSADMHDTTTIGDNAHEQTPGLLGGNDISVTTFYDNVASTGCYALVSGLLGGAAVTLSFTDGTRTTACSVRVKDLSLPVKVNDMTMLNFTLAQTSSATYS